MYQTGQLVKAKSVRIPFVYHYGILLVDVKGLVYIAHNSLLNPSAIELYSDFQQRREIISITDTHLLGSDYAFVMQRYIECRKPYDVFTYNCEHFINCMLALPLESKQVTFWTVELPLAAFLIKKMFF